jgi:2-polyprenyl-6-hydroxyphenyl methylase/3-demethylubiquinone-9 3-methyltransferase
MCGYYNEKLAAERLRKCYEIAPHRVRQYLEAEVAHVLTRIRPNDVLLELGCGYGRIIPQLSKKARLLIGIDSSHQSLLLGQEMLKGVENCFLLAMNAVELGFGADLFDAVVCIQNGISAFGVDEKDLIAESIRVTKQGGVALFSTYSPKFWKERLEWFKLQSEAGLLGEIDDEKTGDGVIVCKDGFKAKTVSAERFLSLTSDLNCDVRLVEVDESSLFCEIYKIPKRR